MDSNKWQNVHTIKYLMENYKWGASYLILNNQLIYYVYIIVVLYFSLFKILWGVESYYMQGSFKFVTLSFILLWFCRFKFLIVIHYRADLLLFSCYLITIGIQWYREDEYHLDSSKWQNHILFFGRYLREVLLKLILYLNKSYNYYQRLHILTKPQRLTCLFIFTASTEGLFVRFIVHIF